MNNSSKPKPPSSPSPAVAALKAKLKEAKQKKREAQRAAEKEEAAIVQQIAALAEASKGDGTLTPKPKKAKRAFPLGIHKASGLWCKKVKGKVSYFGLVEDDPTGEKALTLWNAEKDDLLAGRRPRSRTITPDGLTVADLCNAFLEAKEQRFLAGELKRRTLGEYEKTTDRLIAQFGSRRRITDLRPEDFGQLRATLAKRKYAGGPSSPVRLSNEIQRVRMVFGFGYEAGLLDKPMRFGKEQFAKPSKSRIRKHRADSPARLFTPEEIRSLLVAAKVQMRAMIYLGINAGLGNTDCSTLPKTALDLERGWLTYARPKTGVPRRAKLWPETVEALKQAIAARPRPRDPADEALVFLTRDGHRWVREHHSKLTPIDQVYTTFGRLLKKLKINGRRLLGFYSLRHTYRTIADRQKDFPAIRLTMGHADGSVDDHYRERIDDDRLEDVAAYVRAAVLAP